FTDKDFLDGALRVVVDFELVVGGSVSVADGETCEQKRAGQQADFPGIVLKLHTRELSLRSNFKACHARPLDNTGKRLCLTTVFAFRYCQRKILSATTKLITHQANRMEIAPQLAASGAPSFITARSESLSIVSGSALTKGWMNCGKRVDVKNVPDSNHIGIITRFIKPDTPSIVLGREATSNPIPANVSAPKIKRNASSTSEPRTRNPNANHANAITTATSSVRKMRRERTNESR